MRALRPHARVLAAILVLVLAACQARDALPDPRTLPYRFEEVIRYTGRQGSIDLDGDGRSELWSIVEDIPPGHHALVLRNFSGAVIEQLNYAADFVKRPHLKNIDGVGPPELLVPIIRNDSLFVSVADATGRKLYSIFLIDGAPRTEPDGIIPWDPSVRAFYLLDVDGDGAEELMTIVATAYARLPRGILIHSLPDGRLVDRIIVGADLVQTHLGDYDGDGEPELLAATMAVNNGARAGGLDDAHSYLLLFEIMPRLRLSRRKLVGDRWQRTSVLPTDWDGDGDQDLLTIVSDQAPEHDSRVHLELLEATSWEPLWKRSIADRLVDPGMLQTDRDARPEVAFLRPPGEIVLFDDDFEILMRRKLPTAIEHLHPLDLDGDGLDGVAALSERGLVLLGPDLDVEASHRGANFYDVLHASDSRPLVVVFDGAHSVALELVPNRWYWVYRYGRPAGGVAGLGAAGLVAVAFMVLRRRNRLLETVSTLAESGQSDGMILLDRRGSVRWRNDSAARCLGSVHDLAALDQRTPELAAFCRESIAADPPQPRSLGQPVEIDGEAPVRVSVEPLFVKARGDPHWVVRLSTKDRRVPDESHAWIIMAQRVAHSLKNPLTSILLSLQRLQMDYREVAPAVANRLDRYTTRIEGRIDELRALTSNFLKFVNLERPAMRLVDLGALIRSFAEGRRRSLPPDIQLNVRIAPDLPPTMVDPEQIEALLDNLVGNAINAMPGGGVVTISGKTLRNVQVGGSASGDYIALEVADTGTGIDDEITARIFEPGFSTAEDGWGLGLAIVKKIVDDHGGTMEVESEADVGTVFSAFVPVRGPEHLSLEHASSERDARTAGGGAAHGQA